VVGHHDAGRGGCLVAHHPEQAAVLAAEQHVTAADTPGALVCLSEQRRYGVLVAGGDQAGVGAAKNEQAGQHVVHGEHGQHVVAAGVDHLSGEDVGSSRVDLQACKLEYSIVSPK